MELFRTLGALIEPPSSSLVPLAEALELGPVPAATAHTDLFAFQLYPYASVYLGAEGQLGGEARDRIAGFWRALGLDAPAEPDHLTVMLALHAELCERDAESSSPSSSPSSSSATEAAGGRWRQARKAHLWEHLASWLPPWLDKLDEIAPPFYCRWGALLRAALDREVETLGPQEALSLHLREAPVLADPREEGAEAFLDALLSPVRSGVVLVRDDLARAARELDLACRVGERRYVLKALLGQDAAAVLDWLGREADDWAVKHRQRASTLGAVAHFWVERAEATAALARELSRAAASPDR